MSSPYRDGGAPSADLSQQVTAPLAVFDVSGAKGVDGTRGADGSPGGSTGADGNDAGDAGPAQPGESAGRISLEMKADDAAHAVKLSGDMMLARGDTRKIDDLVVIDEAGVITLRAIGGDGGRGGDGGIGGDGARGARGSDATRWWSGSDGGSGGDGGRGGRATSGAYAGDGGAIVVTVSDEDTPVLMLLRSDLRGGIGGGPGLNGRGGEGGDGGDGGSSYSWTTTSTSHNSDGTTTTHTHHHFNSGGSRGASGSDGAPGDARVTRGSNGEEGSFAIRVTTADGVETYPARFDLRLISFAHDSLNEDAVYEPGELVRVFDLEVENVGGMPTPRHDELALALAPGGWIEPEPGELRCAPGLAPGARYKVPGELRFRIRAHTAIAPSEPLEIEESILQRALLPSVGRAFEHFQEGDALAQGTFVIRYPVRISPVTALKSLAAGEATRVRFTVTNQSRFALGAASPSKRVLRVRVATAPDSELGDEHVVLLADGVELSPGAGWTHELPVLGAGDAAEVELCVRLRESAPEYLRFAARVTLELGELDAPARAHPVQLRAFDVRVARPFQVSDADLLLVVNHRTTREEVAAWELLGERLAFKLALWDLSRERHLDLERPLADGIALATWFERKALVLLDNPIEDPLGRSTDEIYPHVLLADDQLARAAGTGLDIAVIGKGMPLQRVLVPTHAAEETVLHRRFWLRWWAKPTQAWLEKQAMRRSRALIAAKPTERHVVIHRFAPELDGDSSWVNAWRVGTLHVARTLDAAAGAVVHGEVDARELHDPAYVASDHATTTLLAMFGFDENLARLGALARRDEPDPRDVALVVDALVLDLANELAAVVSPGWMGDESGDDLTHALVRVEALAASGLGAPYDSVAGNALRVLAGRVLFLARSQVAWWEHVPPLRWMRRGPRARARVVDALERFLTGAFGEDNAETALAEADHIADQLAATHVQQQKRFVADRRRVWALQQARAPIASHTITSDTELLTTWASRVMSGDEYDAVTAARVADADVRDALNAGADAQHAELFVAKSR